MPAPRRRPGRLTRAPRGFTGGARVAPGADARAVERVRAGRDGAHRACGPIRPSREPRRRPPPACRAPQQPCPSHVALWRAPAPVSRRPAPARRPLRAPLLPAQVIAVGPGAVGKDGKVQPMSVAVGDKVLLPEYGGHVVKLGPTDADEFQLYRDEDILGKLLQ